MLLIGPATLAQIGAVDRKLVAPAITAPEVVRARELEAPNLLHAGNVDLLSQRLGILDRLIVQAQTKRAERNWMIWPRGGSYQRLILGNQPLESHAGAGMIQPTFTCPVDLTKTSSAKYIFDGGKWVCGLSFLARKHPRCVVYSIGSNFAFDGFEIPLQNWVRTVRGGSKWNASAGCELEVFDPTVRQRVGNEKFERVVRRFKNATGARYHEVGLTGDPAARTVILGRLGAVPVMTLSQMMRQNGHTCVDVLKIDVDGSELAVLKSTNWGNLCAGNLLLEVHANLFTRQRNGTAYSIREAIRDIGLLEDAGFYHFHTETVCSACPGQFELAFVNVTWLREVIRWQTFS
uniref:Methyltransferase domain-containing protein n=1 Tax=Chrysotila carterae TaxID=13221 RepID=A0A7S4C170_CHRCT